MTARRLVAAALLLFVVASVGFLVAEQLARRPGAAQSASARDTAPAMAPRRTVVAYYFHASVRCVTCRTIEAYARDAIETGFAGALRSGALQWRPTNVEEPGNEHFIQDYRLVTRSLVLVDIRDGAQVQWKNLDQVWNLVGDKPAFIWYVQDEVRAYLRE